MMKKSRGAMMVERARAGPDQDWSFGGKWYRLWQTTCALRKGTVKGRVGVRGDGEN